MQISNKQYKIEIINNPNDALIALTFKGHHHTNQDSYAYSIVDRTFLAVADGLGSALSSHKGSSLATSIAIDNQAEHNHTVEAIFPLWKAHLIGEKLSDFDTTLKLAKITADKIKISSVGDGGILYQIDNSGFNMLQDNLDYVNETNSLLQSKNTDAVVYLEKGYITSIDIMIFTDGLDLVVSEKKIVEFACELKRLLKNIEEEELIKYLQEWLDSWIDKNIYDDVTMIFYTKGEYI